MDIATDRAAEAVGEGAEPAYDSWRISELTLGFAALTSRRAELLEKHRTQPAGPLVAGNRVDDSCQLLEISFDHSEGLLDGASRLAVGLLALHGHAAARSSRRAPRSVDILRREFQDALSHFARPHSTSPVPLQPPEQWKHIHRAECIFSSALRLRFYA